MQAPHEEFSLPLGTNMHASASATQQRRLSGQSRRLSSIRSGISGHAISPRHSASSVNARNAARDGSQQQQEQLQQEQLRRASLSASTQSSPSKWWRIRFFRGMMNDVKRRAPYYWSDWTDAWDYRIVPATVYMYFAKYVSSLFCLEILYLLSSRLLENGPPYQIDTRTQIIHLPKLTMAAVFFPLWLSRWICLKKRTRALALMRSCSHLYLVLSYFPSLLLSHWSLLA